MSSGLRHSRRSKCSRDGPSPLAPELFRHAKSRAGGSRRRPFGRRAAYQAVPFAHISGLRARRRTAAEPCGRRHLWRRVRDRSGGSSAFACAVTAHRSAGSAAPHRRPHRARSTRASSASPQLVLEAAHALPADATFDPPTKVGSAGVPEDRLAGFVPATPGAHRAQVPLIVYTPPTRRRHDRCSADSRPRGRRRIQPRPSRRKEDRFPPSERRPRRRRSTFATAFAAPFVVKDGEREVHRLRTPGEAADVDPCARRTWNGVKPGTKLTDALDRDADRLVRGLAVPARLLNRLAVVELRNHREERDHATAARIASDGSAAARKRVCP